MTLLVVAYFGGALTILSPCILPVLPFLFARAGQPFIKSTLPMLAGMAITFALVATLAAIGGSWAVRANEYGRFAAILLLALFGVSLISPRIAMLVSQPAVDFGNRLLKASDAGGSAPGAVSSLMLGIATGLLWAPCAGPILGLVLTGAALQGANLQTTALLVAYAAGAATSLAAAMLVGGGVFARMKRSLGVSERIRQALGVAVLGGVISISLGLDTGFLARFSFAGTASVEQAVLDRLHAEPVKTEATDEIPPAIANAALPFHSDLPVEGPAPSLDGAVGWLNSPALTTQQLRGKVVLVDFWTYSCINCIHTRPYLAAWADAFKDKGLVVVGVHTPEFAYEKNIDNVRQAAQGFKIGYPIAIDNDYRIWRTFQNSYWPAVYLVDAGGRIRYHHFGEGRYAETRAAIESLLREAESDKAAPAPVTQDG